MRPLLEYKADHSIDQRTTAEKMTVMADESGLKRNEIAARMKISAPYLCDLLHGYRNWSEALALRFTKALGQ